MNDEQMADLIGDVALMAESLKQCLQAITSLRPDLKHSFMQQSLEMGRITDRWLTISDAMTRGDE
jgi:hypothetical protein